MTEPFILSQTFNAPRDRVWKAWTEREPLLQWFGPKGMKQGWSGTFEQLTDYLVKQ